MKKHILLLLALALGLGAQAQKLTSIGHSKEMGALQAQRSELLVTPDGDFIFVGNAPKKITMNGHEYGNAALGLLRYGNNFDLKKKNQLKKWKNYTFKGAVLEGGTVRALLIDEQKASSTLCLADFDAQTLQPAGAPSPLLSMPVDKDGRNYWWTATSSNRQHTAVAGIAVDKKGEVLRAELVMLDGAYRKEWSRALKINLMHQLEVRDDGVALLFGYRPSEGGIYLSVQALLENDAEGYEGHIDIRHMERAVGTAARLVREDDGRLLVVGSVANNDKEGNTIGTFALAYDFLEGKLIGSDVRMLDKEEYRLIHFLQTSNVKDRLSSAPTPGETELRQGLPGVGVSFWTATPYGAALAVQARNTVRYYDRNGGMTLMQYHYGTCLYGVDTLGHFRWSNLLKTSHLVTDYNYDMRCFLMTEGENVLLLQNEGCRRQGGGDAETPVMVATFDRARPVLYRVDRQGHSQRTELTEGELENVLVSLYTTPSGQRYLYGGAFLQGSLYRLDLK